jgi:hypothetical protein
MTNTECRNCDWGDNCSWDEIAANLDPTSPKCVQKAWHDKSLRVFGEMKHTIRKPLTVGEFYKNCQEDYLDLI